MVKSVGEARDSFDQGGEKVKDIISGRVIQFSYGDGIEGLK